MRERWGSSFNTIRQENLGLFRNFSLLLLLFPPFFSFFLSLSFFFFAWGVDVLNKTPEPCQINWLTAGGPGEEGYEVVGGGGGGTGNPCQRAPERDVRVSLCYHSGPCAAWANPGASGQRSPPGAIYHTLPRCFKAGRAAARLNEVRKKKKRRRRRNAGIWSYWMINRSSRCARQ